MTDFYLFLFRNTMIITTIAAIAITQSGTIGEVSPVFTSVVPLVVVEVVFVVELGGLEGRMVTAGVIVGTFVGVGVGVGVEVAVGVGIRSISPSFGRTVGE